ncbi:hypothetical protein QM012_005592 [Aureobasidium pullulans]|uniref:Cytochrome P450 n=1 Tax=Aureobasidium pullulans TaxID=5580 RepID=A0ABR0T5C7_AURPU
MDAFVSWNKTDAGTFDSTRSPVSWFTVLVIGVSSTMLAVSCLWQYRDSSLPLVNPNRWLEFTTQRVRAEWMKNAKALIGSGIRKFSNKPFNIMAADVGLTTILPPEYADEIRNNPNLSFVEFMAHLFFSNLPGFEPTREGMFENDIGIVVIQKYLTSLAKMISPLSEEARAALLEIYPQDQEWQTIDLKAANLALVARLSSRIFLGRELCRNRDWLRITVEYTVDLMIAAERLRHVPGPLRRLVHWWLPEAQKLRAEVKQAGDIIRPVLEHRRKEKATLSAQGQPPIEYDDAIDWFEQIATSRARKYDPEIVQLFLSTVAIHTTNDLLTVTLLDIARHPEIIPMLREEISRVVQADQWKKTALHDMQLMDSVLKESLRMKPIGIVSMRRVATSPVTLSDGTRLAKGTKLAVSSHKMWDPDTYPSPDTWDGYRFMRLRSGNPQGTGPAVQSKEAMLVNTSENHLGFGHGKHGCPGRFFSASELKVALAHILANFDIRIPEGYTVNHRITGASYYADPLARLEVRRRDTPAL